MVAIDKRAVKRWSRIGQRAAFGLVMAELADTNENLMVLTADVSTSAGLERYRANHPDQYLDVGISEQNMIGVATGLADAGYQVYTTTFAPFQSMRCLEQIRVDLGYMHTPVRMVGLASGLYHIYLGNTHCCIEDIGVLRTIPGMTILSPADGVEVAKCIEASMDVDGPVYIRLSGGAPLPVVYEDDYDFRVGKGIELREGKDVLLIATGTMVDRALKTAQILEEEQDISAGVVDMHTIKPIDTELIYKYKDQSMIVTMEEHSVIGGLGSAVAEVLSEAVHQSRQLRIGVPDIYPHAMDYEAVMDACGLSVDRMVEKIIENYGKDA